MLNAFLTQAVAREEYCNRLREIANVTLQVLALLRITERCANFPEQGSFRPYQITQMIDLWQKALVSTNYFSPPNTVTFEFLF